MIKTNDRRKKALGHLITKYLHPGSEFEVNVPDYAKRRVLEASAKEVVESSILDHIHIEVQLVLNADCLSKFLLSSHWNNYLQKRPDTLFMARSRRKAEWYFGESMRGPLKREEVVHILRKKGFERSSKQRDQILLGSSTDERERISMGASYGVVRSTSLPEGCMHKPIELMTQDEVLASSHDMGMKEMIQVSQDQVDTEWSWTSMTYVPKKKKKFKADKLDKRLSMVISASVVAKLPPMDTTQLLSARSSAGQRSPQKREEEYPNLQALHQENSTVVANRLALLS
eukprot:TRINITY_DN898_c0_g1_i1.p1 TRINITY_DN898_c0_g1~~TRINITY_DN898_c0_g1_i1.p1  ORF type:complete len:286 (+),score=43.07 TRINITY_DN898_c0_g1_i1:146-1003(+)